MFCVGCRGHLKENLKESEDPLKKLCFVDTGPLCSKCSESVGDQVREHYFEYIASLPEEDPYSPDTTFVDANGTEEAIKSYGRCWNCGRVFESSGESSSHLEVCPKSWEG
jgi:hypothetical protein